MEFGKVQQRRFGTNRGAYSVVTEREFYDSQVTLTDYETDLVVSHFGQENLHVGPVKDNPVLAKKPLRLYPTGKMVELNIVYPKPEKSELRLYLSARAEFKPEGGEIWFLFVKDDEIWIGAMPMFAWRFESSHLKADDSDFLYQESLDETDPTRIARLKARDSFKRDRNIAKARIELSDYSCEYDPDHNLFISRYSRDPFLEAHHLIPLGLQGDFDKPLDTLTNVFSLCPHCHRAVHHAEEVLARQILEKLAEIRPVLNDFSLDIPDLFGLYAVEDID